MTESSASKDAAASPSESTVLAERRGAVMILTLNRPDRLNAWNYELEARYFGLLDEADDDPEVRAIIVTGAGRAFCAGADTDDLESVRQSDVSLVPPGTRPRCHPLTVRKPMIAAINGVAIGLGLVEALYCDIRFAVPNARLSTTFARLGLIAEYGTAWILPRLVGPSRALDLLMSGRTILGEEALRIGLVDHVVEPAQLLEAAIAFAEQLTEHSSPKSMSLIKAQIQRAMNSDFETAFAESEELMWESFRGPDFAEGVAGYRERRPPAFAPLAPARTDGPQSLSPPGPPLDSQT